MDAKLSRMLKLTTVFSVFFLSVCIAVQVFVPASNEDAETEEVQEPLSLFSELSNDENLETEGFDFLAEYIAKAEIFGETAAKEDKGLFLYREPQSRSSVEWFYTHVTNSREVAVAILENADVNNIPLSLAFALAYVESNYKIRAVNRNSNFTIDRGLFQLNSATFPKLTEEDFFNPQISAKFGMSHLKHCMNVAGNEITALAMYNAGTSRVKNNKTPQTTLNYVAKIQNYKKMIDGMFEDEVLAFYNISARTKALAKK